VYRVRVRAKNKYGWGLFSPITSIIAAIPPGISSLITTTQEFKSVKIIWAKPDINGLEITQYDILFRKKDGSFAPTATCLGNNTSVVMTR
jgi:hypothetical protein